MCQLDVEAVAVAAAADPDCIAGYVFDEACGHDIAAAATVAATWALVVNQGAGKKKRVMMRIAEFEA